MPYCCYQSQNYKIWKQFTTPYRWMPVIDALLSIIKLQNLKAIHNARIGTISNNGDVINHKITKLENNSQLLISGVDCTLCCYQSQNYKIWKQITTCYSHTSTVTTLLSITKLQNLKAIHNKCTFFERRLNVVINHKTTKFESNSQHKVRRKNACACCYQSQNYKI